MNGSDWSIRYIIGYKNRTWTWGIILRLNLGSKIGF